MPSWVELQKAHPAPRDGKKPKAQHVAQMNEETAEAIGRIVRENVELPKGTLVTVMDASLDDDMRHLTVTFSALPEDRSNEIKKILNAENRNLRKQLVEAMPHWRQHPKIYFKPTQEVARGSDILQLLDSLQQ